MKREQFIPPLMLHTGETENGLAHIKEKKNFGQEYKHENDGHSWVSTDEIDKIKVKLVGKAIKGSDKGVVCASFNAG